MELRLSQGDKIEIASLVVQMIEKRLSMNNSDEIQVDDLVKVYDVSKRTVYRYIEKGDLPATKRFNRWWVKKRDFEMLCLRKSA